MRVEDAAAVSRLDPLRQRLRFLILTLLAISPGHGYDLSRRIEALTLGRVKASPGSIYPMLRELREEGMVEEELSVANGRARKVYKLTEKGMAALREELMVYREILSNIAMIVEDALARLSQSGRQVKCNIDRTLLEKLEGLREVLDKYIGEISKRASLCDEGE